VTAWRQLCHSLWHNCGLGDERKKEAASVGVTESGLSGKNLCFSLNKADTLSSNPYDIVGPVTYQIGIRTNLVVVEGAPHPRRLPALDRFFG
jgi:hypothetical protein